MRVHSVEFLFLLAVAAAGYDGTSQCMSNMDCSEQSNLDDTQLLQVGQRSSEIRARSRAACTDSAHDPWSSGNFVQCCSGLTSCLDKWDGDGRWFYKCFDPASNEAKTASSCERASFGAQYYPHFDTTPDYLNIAQQAAGVNGKGNITDNFYLIIADHGGCDGGCSGCCERQMLVADELNKYVTDRKKNRPNSNLLFVLAGGDNYYWTGVGASHRFQQTWLDVYGPELTSVPWFAVFGNHDFGKDDPGTACPWKRARFTCNQDNAHTPACGGKNPYSTKTQSYDSNQLNANKGGLGGEMRKNFQAPDYTYFYTIPELDFELVAMDWNAMDLWGLGGDGPYKSARATLDMCGSLDTLNSSLIAIKDASTTILNERSKKAEHKNVAIIGHYPSWAQGGHDFRDMYIANMPKEKVGKTKVFNFFGHAHNQVCFTHDPKTNECVNFQTGGGGGCCGDYDHPGGFTAISWTIEKRQFTECFAPDSRCSITSWSRGPLGGGQSPFPPASAPNDDVCSHTNDAPYCSNYRPTGWQTSDGPPKMESEPAQQQSQGRAQTEPAQQQYQSRIPVEQIKKDQ